MAEKVTRFYQGSVKDLMGPFSFEGKDAVLFHFTDAYSVFDWGRMPDSIAGKGEALSLMTKSFFEKLEKNETWKNFSREPHAFTLRRGVSNLLSTADSKVVKNMSLNALFNEIGEELGRSGLRTHLLGSVKESKIETSVLTREDLAQPGERSKNLLVKKVNVVPPVFTQVLGKTVVDYDLTRKSAAPRLIPLEVVFRFALPKESSLRERLEKNPDTALSLALPKDLKLSEFSEESRFEFPLIEAFTKLEPSDRSLSFGEAMAISGVSADQLERVFLLTAWVSGFLRSQFSKSKIDLLDGKLEWAIDETGQVMLVDGIGPDELRLVSQGVSLSKECLRQFYRKTPWFDSLARSKEIAKTHAIPDFKRFVTEAPPALPEKLKQAVTQMYLALANEMSAAKHFENAWSIEKVIATLKEVSSS